jgi:hypothetical protein
MRDLSNPGVIWAKAALLLVIGLGSAALIVISAPAWPIAFLLAVCVWAFCRAYYFAFYVIERYVDPGYRFSGLLSVVSYLWRGKASKGEP